MLDLTPHEKAGRFLEGTGSLVLDHVARVAYACRSPRTHDEVGRRVGRASWATTWRCSTASDECGTPIYHTNVLMHVGTRVAVVALDAIGEADRARIAARLANSGRDIVAIDHAEMGAFAGNMLEVGSWDEYLGDYTHPRDVGDRPTPRWRRTNTSACTPRWTPFWPCPVDVIERHGGGSVRCMLAEIFLP